MAYINQKMKAKLLPGIKEVLKKYGVKGTVSIQDHAILVLNIKSGSIDFMGNYKEVNKNDYVKNDTYIQINTYCFKKHFSGVALEFLTEVYNKMNQGNHDNSDIQSDYFDVGWYVDINIGKWDKPYELTL